VFPNGLSLAIHLSGREVVLVTVKTAVAFPFTAPTFSVLVVVIAKTFAIVFLL
jgi:hypothetical protein